MKATAYLDAKPFGDPCEMERDNAAFWLRNARKVATFNAQGEDIG